MKNKLIVTVNNFQYFGIWVDAGDVEKQREAFAGRTHLIADSPIEAAMFLKVAVSKIQILNNFPNEQEGKAAERHPVRTERQKRQSIKNALLRNFNVKRLYGLYFAV